VSVRTVPATSFAARRLLVWLSVGIDPTDSLAVSLWTRLERAARPVVNDEVAAHNGSLPDRCDRTEHARDHWAQRSHHEPRSHRPVRRGRTSGWLAMLGARAHRRMHHLPPPRAWRRRSNRRRSTPSTAPHRRTREPRQPEVFMSFAPYGGCSFGHEGVTPSEHAPPRNFSAKRRPRYHKTGRLIEPAPSWPLATVVSRSRAHAA
jgi:hypothetical protein